MRYNGKQRQLSVVEIALILERVDVWTILNFFIAAISVIDKKDDHVIAIR